MRLLYTLFVIRCVSGELTSAALHARCKAFAKNALSPSSSLGERLPAPGLNILLGKLLSKFLAALRSA